MMPKFPFFTAQQLNLDWIMQTLKKILAFMPIDKGAVGDVLQRKANGAAWEPLGAVSLDIHGMQTAEAVADDDEIPIYDKTATGNRKATVAAIRAGVSSPVASVNGKTGAVVLDAADVGALAEDYTPPVTSVNGQTGAVVIPTGGGAVDSVNGMTGAVVLGKSDVGLGNVDNVTQYSANNPPPYPVTSVNGQTGAVVIPTGDSSPVLLWTNSNPLNAFAGQTLSLDLSAYSFVIIEFVVNGASGYNMKTDVFHMPTITPPSSSYAAYDTAIGFSISGSAGAVVKRELEITSTYIRFGSGTFFEDYNNTNTGNNNCMIPSRIWGMK